MIITPFRKSLCIFIIMVTFNACKKDIVQDSMPNPYINKVSTWITAKMLISTHTRENIELLQKSLDYGKIHEVSSINNEKILIIPIKEGYKIVRKLNKTVISNLLVIINNKDQIQAVNIVHYTPKAGQIIRILPENTFYNIRNTATNITDGNYRFCGLSGERQYELSYEDGVLVTEAKVQIGNSTNLKGLSGDVVQANYLSGCYDLYLITSHYDGYGNFLGSDIKYLGRFGSCGGAGVVQMPQPDEGGGGGNQPPEEIINAKKVAKIWLVASVTDIFGIYKTNTFTTRDTFILGIGFGGLGTSHLPSNAVVEQVSATGNISPLLDAATTNCSVSVKYSNSPIEPEIYNGSRNWTYSEVSN